MRDRPAKEPSTPVREAVGRGGEAVPHDVGRAGAHHRACIHADRRAPPPLFEPGESVSKEHVSTWAAHREVGLRVRDFGDVFAQLDERVPWKLVTFVAQSPTLEWPSDVFDDVFRALISYCSGRKQDRSTAANLKDVALAAELEDRAKRLRAAVASRLELDTPSDTEARLAAKKRPASAADT